MECQVSLKVSFKAGQDFGDDLFCSVRFPHVRNVDPDLSLNMWCAAALATCRGEMDATADMRSRDLRQCWNYSSNTVSTQTRALNKNFKNHHILQAKSKSKGFLASLYKRYIFESSLCSLNHSRLQTECRHWNTRTNLSVSKPAPCGMKTQTQRLYRFQSLSGFFRWGDIILSIDECVNRMMTMSQSKTFTCLHSN